MAGIVESRMIAVRFARAWREAAAESVGIDGALSSRIDDECAAAFAKAMIQVVRDQDEAGQSRLSAAATRLGSSRAQRGGSIYDLVFDLVALESAALQLELADARVVQAAVASALLAGTAAFARVAGQRERKRIREARHDLMNAVGAVKNAIVLMDDGASNDARNQFLSIARRNSNAAQQLVREHLSEETALPGWLECSSQAGDRAQSAPAGPEGSAPQQRRNLAGAHERHDRNAELR